MRLLSLVLMLATPAMAVTTSSWTHTSESDFDGEKDHVVAVGTGELRLSRATDKLVEQDPRFDVVFALGQLADGSTVLATGPNGAVMKLSGGKLSELFKPRQMALATALAVDGKGQLLVGYSGEKASVSRIDPATGKAEEIFKGDDAELAAQFIWAIAPLPDGTIILGTGPAGKLIAIGPDGRAKVVVTLRQHNILSVLPQAKDMVIVGTDPDGLVVRVNVVSGEWFVLYDALEPEITALAADKDGNIYAAGSAAVETPGGEGETPEQKGKSDLGPEIPLHREPPATPEPPTLPDPTPGEPEPIPKNVPTQRMAVHTSMPTTAHVSTTQPAMPPGVAGPQAAPGNSAVYRIAPNGFVTELFRKPVTIHSMLVQDGVVLVGTGPEAKVYEIRPSADETTVVAEADARDISAMGLDKDGKVLLATSNPGGLLKMDRGYAQKGIYTSKALDAGQPAMFGNLQLQGTLAANTGLTIATRSGNVEDPENGGWSKWSEDKPAGEFVKVIAPPARFVQYRLTLSSKDPEVTPVIEELKLFYQLPNAAPKITAITIAPGKDANAPQQAEGMQEATPAGTREVTWEATDPNNDKLEYALYYRMGHRGQWVLLKDKLTEAKYTWNTKQLADGRYQLKVVASDQLSNPSGEGLTAMRYSDPVVIDNTAPVIGDVKTKVEGDKATVSLRVVDRTSIVAGVQYAVDSNDDWQGVLPSGMLYDSPDESVTFTVSKLAPGPHQLTIRASDSQGNTAYETLVLTGEAKK